MRRRTIFFMAMPLILGGDGMGHRFEISKFEIKNPQSEIF
jgi:hypothetical protein